MTKSPSHVFPGPLSPGAESNDYSALWHFKICNLPSEISQISTSCPPTPDKEIGTLCAKCGTHECLLKSTNGVLYQLFFLSLLSGKIEGSQTCVP